MRGDDSDYDLKIDSISFSINSERDAYLADLINWITEEQFTGYAGAPDKVGELCAVGNDNGKHWNTARVIAILPQEYTWRYIYDDKDAPKGWACATHALSIIERAEPKIEGDVYTWEI